MRSRASFGPVASAGLWFFAHTIPWLPAGPTSIDFKPTDNPKTIKKLQNDPLMLHQPRFDMGYGLVELMDAARDAAERVHLPYLMLHGMGDRLVPTARCARRSRSCRRARDSKLAFYKNGYHLLMRDKEGPKVVGRHRGLDRQSRGRAALGRRRARRRSPSSPPCGAPSGRTTMSAAANDRRRPARARRGLARGRHVLALQDL